MKDHELRELINDVTAVARIYAHTQQLREQIGHLIVPVFSELQCESEFRHGQVVGGEVIIAMHEAQIQRQLTEIENLNRQLDFEVKQRIELRKELAAAQARNEEK